MVASDQLEAGDTWDQWCYWCRARTRHTAVPVVTVDLLETGEHETVLAQRCENHASHGKEIGK